MAQLLIVDDEAHVVDRFAATIDWKSEGIEQVHKAYSGLEAFELLQQISIDIVVTDIKMPGMSGIELIAEIRRTWPTTKCILLSGYSEFNYAKQAMLLQTEDYLLKPVKEEDLLGAVRRVRGKLEREWEEVVSSRRLTYTLKENLPLIRANLLLELLQGKKWNEQALREKMNMLDMGEGAAWTSFTLMIVRLDEHFLQYDAQDLSWKEYAVSNMAEELFGGRYAIWHAKDVHDYLVFLMTAKQGDDPVWFERTAAALQSAACDYLKSRISIMVGRRGAFPRDVHPAYNRAIAAFRRRIGSESELFMRLEEDDRTVGHVGALHGLHEPPTLIQLLEAARWDAAEDKLRSVFEAMESGETASQEHLLEMYFTIASAYAYTAHKNGRLLAELIGIHYERMTDGVPLRSLNHLREWSLLTLRHIQEDTARESRDTRSSLIEVIRSFIEENVTRDISLQSIADRVMLHPVYVSKVYKLETGENISDYVQRAKMGKAEFLLKNSQDKIYEIADKLGYQRPHSFIHAFKKALGMTPQEYRDRYGQ
ncbi:response regulator [Paenibacillus arenilitoris]|uniref:Response regulator n=1 Tax=Paenibacillus arenilitoris TaxID=2772299 RepID=A0A927H545_9BACL|nr:response regulator [Paenibacillus arenilitoris]MBD2867169.1 response regulator [Paenibacillus arenilitoris]